RRGQQTLFRYSPCFPPGLFVDLAPTVDRSPKGGHACSPEHPSARRQSWVSVSTVSVSLGTSSRPRSWQLRARERATPAYHSAMSSWYAGRARIPRSVSTVVSRYGGRIRARDAGCCVAPVPARSRATACRVTLQEGGGTGSSSAGVFPQRGYPPTAQANAMSDFKDMLVEWRYREDATLSLAGRACDAAVVPREEHERLAEDA